MNVPLTVTQFSSAVRPALTSALSLFVLRPRTMITDLTIPIKHNCDAMILRNGGSSSLKYL